MAKLGLCLSGGGGRGAYQIGVAKALEDLGYFDKIEVFSGTSIGSVNAAFLATTDIDKVKEIWLSVDSESMKAHESFFSRLRHEKIEVIHNGIYRINALEQTLKKFLDIDKIKKQKIYVTLSPAGMADSGVTGLLKASYAHYIKKDSQVIYSPLQEQEESKMYKQLLSSCSIPFAFSPVKLDGKQFYDGGLYDNVPVKPLIDAGCDTIIVILLHKYNFFDQEKYPNIKFHEIIHNKSLGGILNFDPLQTQKRFEYGYEDTIEYFRNNMLF